MRPPTIHKSPSQDRTEERGITMVLVAVAMVAIIAMAALSIDVITLYLDREEAQRSADAAALAAARVLSLSGVTGDPNNTQGGLPSPPWPAACTLATQVAQAIANQNSIGNAVANTPSVTFLYNGTTTDCSGGNAGFGINPQVKVQITRQGLPTMFSRIWSRGTNTVSATALAEAFNPSNSGTIAPNGIVAVNPRCVKPWIIPNQDPGNGNNPFVALADGSIQNPGIRLSGVTPGVVGETLTLTDACTLSDCGNVKNGNPAAGSYIGALVNTGAAVAVPTCADDSPYQEAVGGCDQSTPQATPYACGFQNGAQADLTINPGSDTYAATQCLIHQPGQDFIDTSIFPYQIHAGSANPVINSGLVTSSTSIVSIPIYDQTQGILVGNSPQVTIVGFLQAFITQANSDGSLNLTVLNVSGCSNVATTAAPAAGTSPVPIRLITITPP